MTFAPLLRSTWNEYSTIVSSEVTKTASRSTTLGATRSSPVRRREERGAAGAGRAPGSSPELRLRKVVVISLVPPAQILETTSWFQRSVQAGRFCPTVSQSTETNFWLLPAEICGRAFSFGVRVVLVRAGTSTEESAHIEFHFGVSISLS